MEETQTTKPALPGAFSLFRPSFDALMLNVWTFLGLFLVPMAGIFLAFMLGGVGEEQAATTGVGILIGIISLIFLFIMAPALPFVQLKSVEGRQVGLGEALKAGIHYFWRFYGLSLLVGVIVVIGLVLLIVPGIFMLQRYYLAPYYLYDQNLKILEAMQRSKADAKVFSGAVWGLIGVTFLIQLPGVIPIFGLVSGILALIYYCAPVVRYFQIKSAVGPKAS